MKPITFLNVKNLSCIKQYINIFLFKHNLSDISGISVTEILLFIFNKDLTSTEFKWLAKSRIEESALVERKDGSSQDPDYPDWLHSPCSPAAGVAKRHAELQEEHGKEPLRSHHLSDKSSRFSPWNAGENYSVTILQSSCGDGGAFLQFLSYHLWIIN